MAPRHPGDRALVLAGMALGCGDEAPCPEADAAGVKGDDAVVYCDIDDIVDGSDAWEPAADALLDCLDKEWDSAEREAMLQQLESASEDELASLIEQYARESACWDDDVDAH